MQVFDRMTVRRRRDRAAATAEDYDFLFSAGAAFLADRLRDIKRDFPTVLELGCRTGTTARAIRGLNGIETIIGTDLSPAMAQRADGNGPDCVVAADEELLPFAPSSFDMVISNLSMHWINDLPGAMIQAQQALKPDGVFLSAFLGGETLHELRRCMMDAEIGITGGVSPRVSPMADLPDAAGLLQRAGFALPVVDSETLHVSYENVFGLMRDLRGMGESNTIINRSRIPLRRDVLMETARLYAERFSDDEGRITATFQIIFMIGWRPHESQQQPLRPGSAKNRLAEVLGTTEISTGVKAAPNRPVKEDKS